ncbi:MAG: hypothetical protein KC619_04315 [Myxococcales bacterium]|nr:hypothetical protein [Myxococcales bacterium]
MRWSFITAFALSLLVACGANETGSGTPRSEPPPAQEESAPTPEEEPPAQAEAEPEPAPEPEPVRPPEPEPVDIEAGARLGPIRIGMSEADVRALGLEESVVDPRTTAFGPYHVQFRDGAVRSVEALIGPLGAIRFGDQVLRAGTHISAIRDAFGDCTWTEGGGERYVCANGTLFVHTTHTMDPQRYTVGVEAP